MKKRLTRHALEMIEHSISCFPELNGKTITLGYTRRHLGSATVAYRKGVIWRLVIRLKVRKLSYQTIGHELTHLVQGLARGDRGQWTSRNKENIPSGETQCDIWTLARSALFCDDPPSYLRLPRTVRERWRDYADHVRGLCVAAIEKRKTHRRYIRWLESEIQNLPRRWPAKIICCG